MAPRRDDKPKSGRASRPRHYASGRWVDFARGLVNESDAAEMTTHAADCVECHDLMTFWAKLAATACSMQSTSSRTSSGNA